MTDEARRLMDLPRFVGHPSRSKNDQNDPVLPPWRTFRTLRAHSSARTSTNTSLPGPVLMGVP